MCPIIKLLFHTKICSLLRRGFTENSLSMACCTFNVLGIRTITPNRFKNQSGSTLKILAHDYNHQQGLLNKKMSLFIIVVLRQNFLNTLIKITILGKIYQCNTFGRFKISALTSSSFKNETNDALKLLGCNDNH